MKAKALPRPSTLIIGTKRSVTNFTYDILASHYHSIANEPLGLQNDFYRLGKRHSNPLDPWNYSSKSDVSQKYGHARLKDDPYGSLLARNLLHWVVDGDKLLKETDFLHLGWLLNSVPVNLVIINRDPRGSIASFKTGKFYQRWRYEEKMKQFIQTIESNEDLAQYRGFANSNRITTYPYHRQLAFYYSVAMLEIARNTTGRASFKVDYENLTNNWEKTFEAMFEFLSLPWNESTRKPILDRRTQVRASGPHATFLSKDVSNFTDILSVNEEADIRAVCREYGIYLPIVNSTPFRGSDWKRLFPDSSSKFLIKAKRKNIVVSDIQRETVAFCNNEDIVHVSKFLVTNEQFAQFLQWLEKYNIQVSFLGKPLFYNDRPQSHIHFTGKGIVIDVGYQKHPVTFVTWIGAAVFCAWIGGRLPTIDEWKELISPQNEKKLFWPTREEANVSQFYADTTPVDFFASDAKGLYDSFGNASIWTQDGEDYHKAKVGPEWNYTQEKPISGNERPYWIGSSGLSIRPIFDNFDLKKEKYLVVEIKKIVHFLTKVHHSNIKATNKNLFAKVLALSSKKM